MSTVNKTQSSTQFDPGSMGVFSGLNQAFGQGIQSDINNPYSNMAFNTRLGMQNQFLGQQQGQQTQALLQRARAMGINPDSPAFFSQLNQLQRQGMANQAGGFNNLLLQAAQLRQGALGMAGSYRPLQTGQTQVQSQSGAGQYASLIGAGLGLAAAPFTGGMSLLGTASAFRGGNPSPTNTSSPFFNTSPGMDQIQGPQMGFPGFNPTSTYNPFTGIGT